MAESIIKMEGGVIRQQKNTILKNVNIDIASGEFVYLIGKVGSGKSSFKLYMQNCHWNMGKLKWPVFN